MTSRSVHRLAWIGASLAALVIGAFGATAREYAPGEAWNACEAGDGRACNALGLDSENQFGARSALPQYDRACELKFEPGCKNSRRVVAILKCESGDSIFCYSLGEIYERSGQRGPAFEAYRRACDLGTQAGCESFDRLMLGKPIPPAPVESGPSPYFVWPPAPLSDPSPIAASFERQASSCDNGDAGSCNQAGEEAVSLLRFDVADLFFQAACKMGLERGCQNRSALKARVSTFKTPEPAREQSCTELGDIRVSDSAEALALTRGAASRCPCETMTVLESLRPAEFGSDTTQVAYRKARSSCKAPGAAARPRAASRELENAARLCAPSEPRRCAVAARMAEELCLLDRAAVLARTGCGDESQMERREICGIERTLKALGSPYGLSRVDAFRPSVSGGPYAARGLLQQSLVNQLPDRRLDPNASVKDQQVGEFKVQLGRTYRDSIEELVVRIDLSVTAGDRKQIWKTNFETSIGQNGWQYFNDESAQLLASEVIGVLENAYNRRNCRD